MSDEKLMNVLAIVLTVLTLSYCFELNDIAGAVVELLTLVNVNITAIAKGKISKCRLENEIKKDIIKCETYICIGSVALCIFFLLLQNKGDFGLIQSAIFFTSIWTTYLFYDIKREEETRATVDVQKVKHGHWVYKERTKIVNVKMSFCSVCGEHSDIEDDATPYCPYCGARMDGEKE